MQYIMTFIMVYYVTDDTAGLLTRKCERDDNDMRLCHLRKAVTPT